MSPDRTAGGGNMEPRRQARAVRPPWRQAAAVAAAGLLLTTMVACNDDHPASRNNNAGTATPGPVPTQDTGPKAAIAFTEPAANASDVEPLGKVAFTTENADSADIQVKDAAGKVVDGKK